MNWEQSLTTLTRKGEWLDAFSFGLKLYAGEGVEHLDLPNDRDELMEVLFRVVQHYIHMPTIGWEYKISNAIEYCIGLNAIEFLFEDVFEHIIDAGPTRNFSIFMEQIEPYILSGEVTYIPKMVLGKIIGFFLNSGEMETLEKIIVHLDPETIDPNYVFDFCVEYKLLTAYIYVNTRTYLQDFLSPIHLIYNIWLESNDQDTGYRLLWYLRMCLEGIVYPDK